MSRFQLLSDAQWLLIEDLLPVRTGKKGRPFRDVRQVVEGIIYRYRCGDPVAGCARGVWAVADDLDLASPDEC